MVRILKSIPMVVMKLGVQASSQNRRRRHDLPTPEDLVDSKVARKEVMLKGGGKESRKVVVRWKNKN